MGRAGSPPQEAQLPFDSPSATALLLFIGFSEEAVFLLHQDQPLLVDFREHHLSARPQQPLQPGLPRSIHKAASLAPTTAASISICPHSAVSLHRELQALGGLQRLGAQETRTAAGFVLSSWASSYEAFNLCEPQFSPLYNGNNHMSHLINVTAAILIVITVLTFMFSLAGS